MVNAFPYDSAPKYVIRDRDKVYGVDFVRRMHAMGIEQVLSEQHLRRILRKYLAYYHSFRTHLALGKDAPELRKRESIDGGKVIALPMVGGLHHRYTRRRA